MIFCSESFNQLLKMVSVLDIVQLPPSSQTNKHMVKSSAHIGLSLIWVAILGVIVLFIYAVVSFAFLHESFQAENNNDGDLFCSTLYECFASTIRYGLLDNLGLVCGVRMRTQCMYE